MLRIILISILLTFISSCASSSHVLIGEKRSPISVNEVKIYSKEPKVFDVIAIIDASSKNSMVFTEQQKMDTAMVRLKEEAAKLGANGIILGSIGEEQVLVPMTQPNGTTTYISGSHKAIKATAIYVDKSNL